LKIADFGITTFHSQLPGSSSDAQNKVGTLKYGSPEWFLRDKVLQSNDIWSLGCVLLEFVTWYMLGLSGLEDFEERRLEPDSVIVGFVTDTFFSVRSVTSGHRDEQDMAVIASQKSLGPSQVEEGEYVIVNEHVTNVSSPDATVTYNVHSLADLFSSIFVVSAICRPVLFSSTTCWKSSKTTCSSPGLKTGVELTKFSENWTVFIKNVEMTMTTVYSSHCNIIRRKTNHKEICYFKGIRGIQLLA
jgi:serine/threonine protein kinase